MVLQERGRRNHVGAVTLRPERRRSVKYVQR